jgi:hypothetical protein
MLISMPQAIVFKTGFFQAIFFYSQMGSTGAAQFQNVMVGFIGCQIK